jgi:glycosyltransferase involved in cell wall biosynthesis
MRVWLLHVGEELPVDGPQRRYRYGYLAEALRQQGHEVVRWAPTFRHLAKLHRFTSDRRVTVASGYDIQFVHAPGYRRNVGLRRLYSYRALDRRFRALAASEPQPEVIVAAIPSLEWANAAVDFAQLHRIPVVIDVRDIWPDVYLNALPRIIRPATRLLLARQFQSARRACRGASALMAVSQSYLQWALKLASRAANQHDTVVPLGYEADVVPAEVIRARMAPLAGRGIDPRRPTCFFAGRFERSYDLSTVVDAARILQSEGNDLQFVLCGDGAHLARVAKQARGLRNVAFLGWVDTVTVQAVASFSCIGLCAYARDATQSVPNKPFEYMASRVAVVSSLSGEMAELLDRHQCGRTYHANDACSLADCLASLLRSRDELDRMRTNAYEAWSHHYRSADIYADFARRLTDLTRRLALAA